VPARFSRRSWRSLTLGLALSGALLLSGCQGLLTTVPDEGFQAAEVESSDGVTGGPQFPSIDESSLEAEVVTGEGDPASELVSSWTLEEKIVSLFLIHISGTSLSDFERTYDDLGVAGFLLLGNNVPGTLERSQEFVGGVRQLGEPELLVAIDQEGGAVERLQPDPFPAPAELGALPLDDTTEATTERNSLVFDVGANVNLGVIADVSPGSDAYIHERSFGTDAAEVADYVSAALDGSVDGVATAVKHFPGHGLTSEDTHETIGESSIALSTWFDEHAPPFLTAVNKRVPLLMFGHLVVPSVDDAPASLSSEWVKLVRQQWGYDGILITDDLSMLEDSGDDTYQNFSTNALRAVAAGMDLIIDAGGNNRTDAMNRIDEAIATIAQAVNEGGISITQIDASAIRVAKLRFSLGGVSRPLQNAEAG